MQRNNRKEMISGINKSWIPLNKASASQQRKTWTKIIYQDYHLKNAQSSAKKMHSVPFATLVTTKMKTWSYSVGTATYLSTKAVMGLTSYQKKIGNAITVSSLVSDLDSAYPASCVARKEERWSQRTSSTAIMSTRWNCSPRRKLPDVHSHLLSEMKIKTYHCKSFSGKSTFTNRTWLQRMTW